MHSLLDGTLTDRSALDAHVQGCPACRSRLALLERVHEAVVAEAASNVPDARVEGITKGVLRKVRAGILPGPLPSRLPAWAPLAAAAALLAAFCLGGLAGGAIVERRGPAPAVTAAPRVVERVVERKVPVMRERVVERILRVPVVQRRVIYRDHMRAARTPSPGEPAAPLVTHAERVVAADPSLEIQYTQSFHLARAVEPQGER
jgi:anti-sigma factor RsiW